jgi:cell division protein FtsZ
MATGKRASMREGPLADLFRKTAEDTPETPETPEAAAPAAPQAPAPVAPEPPARRTTPHPSLDSAHHSPTPGREAAVPSPQERLRGAFSSDIPQDILEQPVPDVYARSERELDVEEVAPAATGGPVLRVVGVGGAGVNAINRMV